MASLVKRARYTRDEVVAMLMEGNESDVDSNTGGLSSDEEFALDEELLGDRSESEAR